MLQVELSSFQSFYKASSKSPFKSFPWKSGSMHFRFLPVSPLGQQVAITPPCTLHGPDDHITSPEGISQHQTSASTCSCEAVSPHQGATQCPLQAASLRCLADTWHDATPAAALSICHAASCSAAPCRSRPVHHSVDLRLHHALQQLVAAGQYTTLLTCRRALPCSTRRHLSANALLPYREIPLKPQKSLGHDIANLKFETAFEHGQCAALQEDTALKPNPLSVLHMHRRILGLIGVLHCPSTPDFARAYAQFEHMCR